MNRPAFRTVLCTLVLVVVSAPALAWANILLTALNEARERPAESTDAAAAE